MTDAFEASRMEEVAQPQEGTGVPVGGIHVDTKFQSLRELFAAHRYQFALDRLNQMWRQGVFRPDELWRVYQAYAVCYLNLLQLDKMYDAYWLCLTHPEGMPYRIQCDMYSNYLFLLHYRPRTSKEYWRTRNFLYSKFSAHAETFRHDPRDRTRRHGKIRVGYIAHVFVENILSFFCVQLWTRYDHARFEVYLYSLRPARDHLTAELDRCVTKLRIFEGNESSHDIAQAIYDDGIDILFNIPVHAEGGHELQAMRFRPAPVQVAGIGYMSTSGLPVMNYFLTDRYLDPPGAHDEDFTEELVRLPHSHFCYTPPERAVCITNHWHPHERIFFASFNNFLKLNDDVLVLWRRILARVPQAQMLLKDGGSRPWLMRRVKDRARALGLPMDRLIFEGSDADYFNRYGDVDILLDAYPYVGGGTTCDALFAGVPVITRYGDRHGTRFGYSLLRNLGLGELAAATDDEYVEKAVALAGDPARLAKLHAEIAGRMKASPVMDGAGYVRDVEAAYQKMWQRYLAGRDRKAGFPLKESEE